MSLFGKNKVSDKEKDVSKTSVVDVVADEKEISKKSATPSSAVSRDIASVIVRPRITEKAAIGMEQNMYTFEIRSDANKYDVRDAIKEIYKVTPKKIRIVKKQPRHYISRMRGRNMMNKGLKKAYVYLKKDDRIDLV